MSRTDLYIIAAGNGSRIRARIPKALIPIAGEPCLTTTLSMIGDRFRKVFVVTNALICDQWYAYFRELERVRPQLAGLVVNLPIRSGLGDGHATLRGIQSAEFIEGAGLCRDVVILWGDVFLPDSSLVDELLSVVFVGSGILPATHETAPYVALAVDDKMRCISADFAKHGEQRDKGFHDQSVFRFDRLRLKNSLQHLHNALWKNGRYITPGGELSLLYTFHHLYNKANPVYVYETRHSIRTFNTEEEVNTIRREVDSMARAGAHCVVNPHHQHARVPGSGVREIV